MMTIAPPILDGQPTEPRDKNARDVPSGKRATHTAVEEWIGGYYVIDHSHCGVPDLPSTRDDTFGFVNNCAGWQKRSFVYADDNVWVDDFKSGSDYYASSDTVNGFDGADSPVIAYVSTHGKTDGTTFRIVTGGNSDHGGCRVYTTAMSLGENNLRYLFLSTCESVLKDPRAVWGSTARGIRALFGYDNDAVDSDKYGQYFFENWKKAGAKTTDSFLDASWRISHDQTPVATWCGPNQATAEGLRDTETYFQLGAITCGWMASRWLESHALDNHADLHQIVPMTVHFHPVPAEPPALFEAFGVAAAGAPVTRTTTVDGNECYSTGQTHLVYSTVSGAMDLRTPAHASRTPVDFSDADAVDLALDYLNRNRGLLASTQGRADNVAMGLGAAAIRHTVEGVGDLEQNYAQRRIQTTVIFRPSFDGVPTIGTGGVIEISVTGDREIGRVRSVLRSIASVERSVVTRDVPQLRDVAERRALAEIRAMPRVDGAELVRSEFGFFSADESVAQTAARPAFRVLVRMEGGSFARLVERVYYLDDLG
jgi:hypothetical protein